MTVQLLKEPTSLRCISRVDEFVDLIPDYVVARYQADFDLDNDTAWHHAREAVRYLAMCTDRPYANYGMAGQVDEFWHTFILHTQAYMEWCQRTFGFFVHHTPTLPEEKESVRVGDSVDTYALFHRDYSLFFGDVPPAVWPQPRTTMNDCGGGGCGGGSCGGGSCSGSSCSSPSSCSTYVPPTNCSSPSSPRPRPSTPPKEKKPRWPFKR
jgi:hypothetical protein